MECEGVFKLQTSNLCKSLFGCSLADIDGLTDRLIEDFTLAIDRLGNSDQIQRQIDPQWVVLAAGKGSRIDPTGRLNKTLDIWFGQENVLDLSRQHLPTTRPHIIVVNPGTYQRLISLNMDQVILCVQETPDGTGGALRAALPEIQNSDAEFIGVAFGDEPFLPPNIFWQTLISHFIQRADITLCAKKPETVVDKGGLFFDPEGRLMGTKEWYDMTEAEQAEMWQRLEQGTAYTNTGITLVHRQAMIERIDRLQSHKNGTEFHHVDLIRHFYQDGLKTNAYVYQADLVSGVNRWSNVLAGEELRYSQARALLAEKGVRVDPQAQITFQSNFPHSLDEDLKIGVGCHFLGRIHLGSEVQIGDYCRLENVTLTGKTIVGNSTSLIDVTADDTVFTDNRIELPISTPISGLRTKTEIQEANFTATQVDAAVKLRSITANATVIPTQTILDRRVIGIPTLPQTLWWDQLVTEPYLPGVFTLGEKRHLPDWGQLRQHIRSHSKTELIARSTRNELLAGIAEQAVVDLLDLKRSDGEYVVSNLTAEQVWGAVFEIVKIVTGNLDPYYRDKRLARQTAFQQLVPKLDWQQKLRLVIAGNIIDYSSARVIKKLTDNPSYFDQALSAAVSTDFSINCFDRFSQDVIEANPKSIVWLIDNDGEAVFDLWLVEQLVELGHRITVVGKPEPASNDATVADLYQMAEHPFFQQLPQQIHAGDIQFISSGSITIGTNLHQATTEFATAILNADLVISKGQGNFFTTRGLRRDTFYLLMSKGITAEESTGVVADHSKLIDGLILGYVPAGTHYPGTLADFCQL